MDYFGDNKFLSFILKPRADQLHTKGHFSNLSELKEISKDFFKRYRQKETETFFIFAQELRQNHYVWYWELMPEVLMWKQKYGKSLHTIFKEYCVQKFDIKGRILIYIAHINHPNYIVVKYEVPNKEYLNEYIELIRTFKMDFQGSLANISVTPIGKSFDMVKIGIKDNYRKFTIYYNILKYNVEVLSF